MKKRQIKKHIYDICYAVKMIDSKWVKVSDYSRKQIDIEKISFYHIEIYLDRKDRPDLKTITDAFRTQHPGIRYESIISWSFIGEDTIKEVKPKQQETCQTHIHQVIPHSSVNRYVRYSNEPHFNEISNVYYKADNVTGYVPFYEDEF